MRKIKCKQGVAVLAAISLLITGTMVPGGASAKGKIKLNKKKVTIKVGQKVKLKLKNTKKKKVTWKSSKKKVASVTKKGVVKGKKKGTAKITAKCGKKKYVCKVTVKARGEYQESIYETARPGSTQAPGASAKPSSKPSVSPSAKPGQNATTTSNHVKPTTATENTLAIGKFNITLGMTSAEVEKVMGAAPDKTGKSPQGNSTYIYNPSGDYTNYVEIQFRSDKVVGMTTISAYFCYADLVSSQDSADALKGRGFSDMSRFDYEAGYQYDKGSAYVNAFVDHQGKGGVYGVQIFDKTLNSKLDNLIMPKNCSYDDAVMTAMQFEMRDFVNAFRVFKGKEAMTDNTSGSAQRHALEMASTGKTQQSSSDGTTWKDRFKQDYGDYYMATEFVADSCVDAFSFAVYAADTTKNITSGSTSTIYQYMIKDQDANGEAVSFNIDCGFAYNTGNKLITFGVINLYCM